MKVLINRLFEQDNIFKPASKSDIETRDKEKIQIWIKDFEQRYNVKKNKDGSYDVNGTVDLSEMNLTKLPVKFGTVRKDFSCGSNQLTSLEGSPRTVGRNFNCDNNQLTSLKGSPETVGGYFSCEDNQLTNLKGGPKTVGKGFWCMGNQLTSLEGSPRTVGKNFSCGFNQLTSLDGCPKTVGGYFDCRNNKKKFTVEEVRKVCNVKGDIIVKE